MFELVKIFDLSSAPNEIRETDDFAPLRPNDSDDETTILTLTVGRFETRADRAINDTITREITHAEYRLHRWLTEQGAAPGEDVFLCWRRPTRSHLSATAA
jgi:hypothetical protein